MALLCLLFLNHTVTAQALNKRITLTVKDATLPQVLQKIRQKYGIRFSYLNNSLPQQQLFSAEIKDKPLAEVLDVLLTKTDIGYLEKNGQVIIRKGLPKKQPKASTFKKLPPGPQERKGVVQAPAAAAESKPRASEKTVLPANTAGPAAEQPAVPAPVTTGPEKSTPPTATTTSAPAAPAPAKPDSAVAAPDSAAGKTWTITLNKPSVKNLFARSGQEDSAGIRPYHFGVIYPLSTNGLQAYRYVNRISGHLLIGTAAGLQGFELSGIGNIERKYVQGFQVAGVFNLVAGSRADSAGSGAGGSGYALQGGQVAGLMNIAGGNSDGLQVAGFMNLARDFTGPQIAGFLNKARHLQGIQIAGFLNKADDVEGLQVAGFLNRAGYVKGTQISVINIADSLAGVPIGLVNIVKKNGYRRLEVYYADDFFANLTYKIGVPHFYTLAALGVERGGAQRWGYGAGFGAEWTLAKALRLSTDLMSYYVVEESYESFPKGLLEQDQLNLLNKFRLLATLQLGRRLALFGGPVYNVFVSEYQQPGDTRVGSGLVTDTFYDHTSAGGTNVKMWIGFNAGIRF